MSELKKRLDVALARNKVLELENAQLRNTIKLHAGDNMSLSNELNEWRERALEAEATLAQSSAAS